MDRSHLKLTKYFSGNHGKYKDISNKVAIQKHEQENEYLKNPKLCIHCNNIISFSRRNKTCCSKSCITSFNNKNRTVSAVTKQKIRQSLIEKKTVCYLTYCATCNNPFERKDTCFYKKYCSSNCRNQQLRKLRRKVVNDDKGQFVCSLRTYRDLCMFRFDLKKFPMEYDFSLIKQHGWYKPTNKGNNLGGISRDHIISVKWGYVNNIAPEIISHPANCRLLIHSENNSKNDKCGMTLSELLIRIEEWNTKYNIND